MSDKFFNAYVESAVSVLHDYVNSTLQLKAQLRVSNELLAEKDAIIAQSNSDIENLKNQILSFQNNSEENEKLKNNAKHWEDSYHTIMDKVGQMEILTKQYNDLKSLYREKIVELEEAQKTIDQLKNQNLTEKLSKKVINTKNTTPIVSNSIKTKEQVADDF
jgi:DNA repair exonuclease SbcCD ATPase subunit